MRESDLTRAVIELAQALGWKVMHIRPAQNARGDYRTPIAGDGKGWPDLFMVHPGEQRGYVRAPLAVELKVGRNKPSDAQLDWLDWLEEAGCFAVVWREQDWLDGTVERVLRGEG